MWGYHCCSSVPFPLLNRTGSRRTSAPAQLSNSWWTHFCHHGESQEIAYETHHSYEDLSPVTFPEDGWIQIHNRGDLAFHFNKLWGQKQILSSQRNKKINKSASLFECMQLLFCLHEPVIREWGLPLLASNENLNKAPLCNTGLLLPRHKRNRTVHHCLCLLVFATPLLLCVSSLLHKQQYAATKLQISSYLSDCSAVMHREHAPLLHKHKEKKPLHNCGMYVWAMLTI